MKQDKESKRTKEEIRDTEKEAWTKPTVTVLAIDSATSGIPNGNAANDGIYS